MKSYKKLRTSYEKVTNSYEQLHKVTDELRKAICGRHLPKSWKNCLPIRAPLEPKSEFHFRASGRFRSCEKPFHRKKSPFVRVLHAHPMWPLSASTPGSGVISFGPCAAAFAPTRKNWGDLI